MWAADKGVQFLHILIPKDNAVEFELEELVKESVAGTMSLYYGIFDVYEHHYQNSVVNH
jgi:hypothetical protein